MAAAAAVVLALVWWRLPAPQTPASKAAPPAVSSPSSPTEATRAIPESAVTVDQPKDGDILSGHPKIRWNGPAETVTYEVQLTTAAGDVLWRRRVPGTVHTVELDTVLTNQPCHLWVDAYLPEGRLLTSNVVKVRSMEF